MQLLFIWLTYVFIGRLFDTLHSISFSLSVKQLSSSYFAFFWSILKHNVFHYRVSLYLIKAFTLENYPDWLRVIGANLCYFPRPVCKSNHNKKSHKYRCSCKPFFFFVFILKRSVTLTLRNWEGRDKHLICFTLCHNFLQKFLSFWLLAYRYIWWSYICVWFLTVLYFFFRKQRQKTDFIQTSHACYQWL